MFERKNKFLSNLYNTVQKLITNGTCVKSSFLKFSKSYNKETKKES